ncbi:MAG: DUF2779 domain-containing protein [Candidatus Taylorbacteria bacterium]|nr:DUF2779 domain-containing protein [Candidatus Taylorbacteria bacterium]
MEITVSKTDFLLYLECPKNAWLKKHKPKVFYASELSEFEKAIIETGNEVELAARQLFPTGVLIDGRDESARQQTAQFIAAHEQTIFQPVFMKDGFLAAVDILQYDSTTDSYSIIEIKASNEIKKDWHPQDLAFQVSLLKKCGLNVSKACIMHLNSDYVRSGDLELIKVFVIEDITETVENLLPEIEEQMIKAREYLSQDIEKPGCDCLYKTRSNHCATFEYSNPDVPEYSVHDISRIGKRKLMELIDSGIYLLENIPEEFELSDNQKNQVDMAVRPQPLIRTDFIRDELEKLVYPLYFLDYETFACALPRFDGFGAYQHIPFQYSLHIVDSPDSEPIHKEFLHIESHDPSPHFARSLRDHIGDKGTVIVWYKPFECGRNRELARRHPEYHSFLNSIESRVYDLRDIFSKQYYVHKEFKGGTSIKDVLPVLVPELSYKKLAIQEGGTASQKWNELANGDIAPDLKQLISENLREYCKLDTYAMYAIWKHLKDRI